MKVWRNWHERNNVSLSFDDDAPRSCDTYVFIFYTVEVNIDEVHADWLKTEGQGHVKAVATHYGIYEHLFGYAYFVPRVPLDIKVYERSISDQSNLHFALFSPIVRSRRRHFSSSLLWKHTQAETCSESANSFVRFNYQITPQQ